MKTKETDVRRWSTEALPPGQRLDYWIGAVCDVFLGLTVEAAETLNSTLDSATLDNIGVSRIDAHGSPQRTNRTSRHIAHASGEHFYLQANLKSAWLATHEEHATRLLPGDLLLVDSRRPHDFHFDATSEVAVLQLPVDWLQKWLVRPEEHIGRRIDGSTGWGAALSYFVREFTPEFASTPPLPSSVLVDQLGGLLTLASGAHVQSDDRKGASHELSGLILAAIRERHAESGLTAGMLAADLGISERTLHRCFLRIGTTFARTLLACRLETARTLLMQARFDRLTVAEIGRRAGFADASHFVHQCRLHLGATPGALRRAR